MEADNTSLEMRRRPVAERKIAISPAGVVDYSTERKFTGLVAEDAKGFESRCVMVSVSSVQGQVEWRAPKPFPCVGDTLTIKHQVKRTSSGDVLGVQRADGKGSSARITAVYIDGTVRVGHSEVWDVKPGTKGHWETVNPMHAERS